ncbi:hypothetical protein ASG35_03105 [Burkholderia sp. Leaf177]|nr:hypothetical protein ASG35_03105 [Burkholderia sp. Leaf177]
MKCNANGLVQTYVCGGTGDGQLAGGRLIVTWATFEALSAKKNGLAVAAGGKRDFELCFD